MWIALNVGFRIGGVVASTVTSRFGHCGPLAVNGASALVPISELCSWSNAAAQRPWPSAGTTISRAADSE